MAKFGATAEGGRFQMTLIECGVLGVQGIVQGD